MPRIFERWQTWGEALTNLLLPRQCDHCYQPSGPFHAEQRLCTTCFPLLRRIESPYCQRCGEAFPGDLMGAFTCANCHDRKLAFDFAYAGFESDGPVREAVHRFKYDRKTHLRVLLGWLIQQALSEPRIAERSDWILVPVPLHWKRRREREFNQSLEIARRLKRATNFPILDGLKRTRYTSSQASLERVDRLENLKGAFAIQKSAVKSQGFVGKSILLIDDILTTGATIHECARVLKQEGGAATVVGLCVARG
jgi:competence protein ComFC